MVKKSKAPSGFYTAAEAQEKLGMAKGTFFYNVKTGKIAKVIPPNNREGYYEKKHIDKMAQAQALFTVIHSIEPITFSRAEEDDLKGIVDLCIAIYGQNGTPSYDARLEIWKKNPEVYYVVKQEDIIVGYVSLIWFDNEALATLMQPTLKHSRLEQTSAGSGVYSITGPDHIRLFQDGQPIDSLFISLGVRPGLSNTEQREYAFKLLRGLQDVLVSFAERGMAIKKLEATSERGEGIILARKFGMTEIRYEGDHLLRYELDVEKSENPLLKPYKQALKQKKIA